MGDIAREISLGMEARLDEAWEAYNTEGEPDTDSYENEPDPDAAYERWVDEQMAYEAEQERTSQLLSEGD